MGKFFAGLVFYPLMVFYWAWAVFTIWSLHLAPIFDPLGFIPMKAFAAIIMIKILLFMRLKNDIHPDPVATLMYFVLPVYSVIIAQLLA